MTARTHNHGRRSLSVFSLQHFRSLTRTGPNTAQSQAPSPSLRSPSSMSCNPYRRTPASPEPTAASSNIVVEGLINPSTTQTPSKTACSPFQTRMMLSEIKARPRPRSWFSFPRASQRKRPARSLSVHLPKDNSSSTVARSVISAPILTGTTNMDVAEAEGVCCRDIIDAGLAISLDDRKSGSNLKVSKAEAAQTKASRMRLFRTPSAKATRQEKTQSLVFENGLLAASEHPSEDTWRFSNVEKGIARRRAETVNLCREKINKLTGHGRIKRKSVAKNNGINVQVNKTVDDRSDDIIGQPHPSTSNTGHGQFLSFNHSNPDLVFGSLTRSFVSAIDKLDFHSSSSTAEDMAFTRSKSSVFNLKKWNKPTDSANTNKDKANQHGISTAVQQETSSEQNADRIKNEAAMIEALRQAQPPNPSSLVGSPPEPLQFSAAANGYVASQPVPHYPRGVKVLGMHSNTMEFATAPSHITDLPKPASHVIDSQKAAPAEVREDDGDDEVLIEDAPIYSPSLGNLSQYARPTPPSSRPAVDLNQRVVPETPIRNQADKSYRRKLGIRKSKSGLGLLSIFNRTQKEPGPLQSRDSNQKVEKRQHLKKSRSMNLAALLKKGETTLTDKPQPKASTPFQAQSMKPSPLRYETQIEDSPASPASPDVVRRRSPPRGSITPADRAKRMGFIGMPFDSLDEQDVTK